MIPVNNVDLSGNEKKYVNECIDTGWISSEGPFVERFENAFAGYIGKKFGIAVTNGTSALEVALFAIGVKEGDEIILPSFTIISCATAILRLGGVPVFVDIEEDTWNINVSLIEAKITNRTKAIMPVHIYGHPVDMDPLLALAEKYSLFVVEDAAEVHGAEYKGRKCGSMGHVSSFSFYANKLVTTGEGGMVLTDDEDFYERALSYRNLCFINSERFHHTELGYNFRMTNIQAAIGLAQVERLDDIVAKKRELGAYYVDKLKKIPGLKLQIEKEWAKSVYWMYCIQLDPSLGLTAKDVMSKLREVGIGTRPFFKGLHTQPALEKQGFDLSGSFPVTEESYEYGLYLPSGLGLTFFDIDTVCSELQKIILNK
jgi:perosamine synthetase